MEGGTGVVEEYCEGKGDEEGGDQDVGFGFRFVKASFLPKPRSYPEDTDANPDAERPSRSLLAGPKNRVRLNNVSTTLGHYTMLVSEISNFPHSRTGVFKTLCTVQHHLYGATMLSVPDMALEGRLGKQLHVRTDNTKHRTKGFFSLYRMRISLQPASVYSRRIPLRSFEFLNLENGRRG
ncbi:hypothetical protein IAQ61_007514 [Plenodomus lingam]|uniref:uncharacterized protein n=1 Tax=Leptosphaeria maculans TaxID=5022 RepID=UPI003327158E|nr:hypothetical protein IAQ61_007514 [Plenodomus lingam]